MKASSAKPRRIQGLSAAGSIPAEAGTAPMRRGSRAHGGAWFVAAVERNCAGVEAMTGIGTWTTERIVLLKNGINAGLSCGQIAQEIGVSRNAVIGKVNRLGLSRLKGIAAGQLGLARTRKNARILRALWAEPQLACVEVPSDSANRRTLLELQQWHCRWPLGDPASESFGFCGNKPVDGLPYCPAHAQRAYRPSTRGAFVQEQSTALRRAG
jgi:GcrA cell cycle regulator